MISVDLDEASTLLKQRLELNGEPVGVSLILNKARIPEGLEPIEGRRRWCEMVQRARFNGELQLAFAENHKCKGGAASIGLIPYPPRIENGEFDTVNLEKTERVAIGRRLISYMPKLPGGKTIATLVAPLTKIPIFPDVVIIAAPAIVARRITQTYIYRHGGRVDANFAGIQSMCADAVAFPYGSGKMNISVGCDGATRNAGLSPNELVIGIPIEQLEEIVNVLDNKIDRWDEIMFSPPNP
ncbi:MAG: DUF169 domain-containing protein [Methermicoccaceae archaeon]